MAGSSESGRLDGARIGDLRLQGRKRRRRRRSWLRVRISSFYLPTVLPVHPSSWVAFFSRYVVYLYQDTVWRLTRCTGYHSG